MMVTREREMMVTGEERREREGRKRGEGERGIRNRV